MKIVNQVIETNDYGMFKSLDGNRIINKVHINRLKQSFQTSYLLSPILVNQNFQIIDGQHRFEAAKALELPINYMVCNGYGLKEVQILNTNMKNWKKEDYLHAFCDLKYPEYLKFRNFMRRFPEFGIKSVEFIITNRLGNRSAVDSDGNNTNMRYFEEGNLKIDDYDAAVENAERIMMCKPYYDGWNRPTFVVAMLGIFRIEYYNHSQLINKLANNPTSMQHCSNVTQYKLLIEDIYNFRSREKVSLRF